MENVETSTPRARNFREGTVARTIERQTARIPSDLFLWGAVGTIALSLIGQVMQPKRMTFFNMPSRSGQLSLWVGQWTHTLLLLGIYNKIVKVIGASDRQEAEASRSIH